MGVVIYAWRWVYVIAPFDHERRVILRYRPSVPGIGARVVFP